MGKREYYLRRTVAHIHRVQLNMLSLVTDHKEALELTDAEVREAMFNVMKHDQSKFSSAQYEPYIELTEYYRQRKNLGNKDYDYPSEEIRKSTDRAWENHYKTENHHPEKYGNEAYLFTLMECLEIICDLQAMAQEYNEGSCRGFFENVWVPKHRSYFQYDDYHWANSMGLMRKAIDCFERKASGPPTP